MAFKLFLKLLIIFYDAVVNADYLAGHIAGARAFYGSRNMRMRIDLGRSSVRRPSCVPYTAYALYRMSVVGLLAQVFEPSYRLDHLKIIIIRIIYGDAGRVVASVLKLAQSLKDNRCRLLRSGISNYPAHIMFLPFRCMLSFKTDLLNPVDTHISHKYIRNLVEIARSFRHIYADRAARCAGLTAHIMLLEIALEHIGGLLA